MKAIPFEPWIGKNYGKSKLLVLSESAYSWQEDGSLVHPGPSHPTCQVLHWMEHFGKQKYHTAMARALCGKEMPTYEERKRAWNGVAFSIFVPGTVGLGARNRPKREMFDKAVGPFLDLLENIRPHKVLVTGKAMWNQMPGCQAYLCDGLQAYMLSNGPLVWCLAVPHPCNREKGEGFAWERVAAAIRAFRAASFPLKI
ncbi:MAG: hypothetical protein ACRD3N_07275 [Terracidiphilus sp.]